MMRTPRGLTTGEQAAWAHLAASVKPLPGKKRPAPPRNGEGDQPKVGGGASKAAAPAPPGKFVKPAKPSSKAPSAKPRPPLHHAAHGPPPLKGEDQKGLDSHWDRRVKAGRLEPDLTLDLHGHTLDTAYDRVMSALDQARAMNARVVLVVAGRERPVDPADRMARRGAIRAKLLDWLAASRHAEAIAAVRRAHIRHGGDGALYLVLKRR
ncbi:Smr/MutS family protein [Porphyrobacter sp. CACIAM 03H1]|uniref:Smr/MutS family protein n=1 Tax=Porphyrobacter sp. CACIAM 03H1 TaxID=2003315 RepID=UPI000B5A740E|nr:Smr/MutS family protein [Porphyrobacter sp. CACIAM 03H1]ASJ92302.1 DNA mismatch repair protein MutS [Porphyrobacter sp. CACIAM 03H1]